MTAEATRRVVTAVTTRYEVTRENDWWIPTSPNYLVIPCNEYGRWRDQAPIAVNAVGIEHAAARAVAHTSERYGWKEVPPRVYVLRLSRDASVFKNAPHGTYVTVTEIP